MKRVLVALLVGLSVGGASVWIAMRLPHSGETAGIEPAHTGETNALHLDSTTQTRIGLVVESVATTNVPFVVRGDARVLDPAPLLQVWNEVALNRIAFENSRLEWERLRTLFTTGQIATARDLETAEAAMKRNEVLIRDAEMRLNGLPGVNLVTRPNFPDLGRKLSQFETVLVRIEFPVGHRWTAPPASFFLTPLNAPELDIPGEWLGPAPSTDPQTQGSAFLALVRTNGLPPGTALIARAISPEPPRTGAFVPSGAVVRHEGDAFIYRKTGPEQFERVAVVLDQPVPGGWLVTSGIANGQPIVVTGAQVLLSNELKSRGAED
ncbi:MAG: hypothetical protein U1G08_11865 [Verrucomicrobiota bacterium]